MHTISLRQPYLDQLDGLFLRNTAALSSQKYNASPPIFCGLTIEGLAFPLYPAAKSPHSLL